MITTAYLMQTCQQADPNATVYYIGDDGELKPMLSALIMRSKDKSVVVIAHDLPGREELNDKTSCSSTCICCGPTSKLESVSADSGLADVKTE